MLDGQWVVGVGFAATGLLTALLTAFGWQARDEIGADWFTATMAVTTVWIFRDVADVFADGRLALVALEWVGTVLATVVPVLWFSFVLAYTGRERLLDRRGRTVVWVVPAVVVASILTSPFHDLYFAEYALVGEASGLTLTTRPGPLAWLNLGYFSLVFVAGLWLIGRMIWEHDRLYSGQAVWLLAGSLAPIAALAYTIATGESPEFSVYPLGFAVLGVAYAYGLFNHRLLDLSPASRRIGVPEAFDDLGEGAVIVDADRDVVAVNDRACQFLGRQKPDVLGRPLATVSPTLAALDPEGGGVDVTLDGRVFAVTHTRVRDARDRPTGEALLIRDVTEDRRREQRMDVLSRVFRHNIRNTMNAVVGPMDILTDRLDGTERDLAETARRASDEVVALSESVRRVEEMMTEPRTPRSLVVADVVDDVAASVRDGTEFAAETSVPPELTVVTDPLVLTVVVEHVVENAAVHAEADAPTVEIRAEGTDSGCFVRVVDEGPGIPEAELGVLRAGVETQLDHGSGIGLWAIHWGITRIGGAVRFDRGETGTRVTLWIPDLDAAGFEASAAGVTGSSARTTGETPAGPGTTERVHSSGADSFDRDEGTWFGSRAPPTRDGSE